MPSSRVASSGRNLMATAWPSVRSSARYTSPIPPRPSSAMMRYRPAIRRPGRNRPSVIRNSAALEDREEELREDGDDDRGGVGTSIVASTSIVANSSVLPTGRPHEEQKRTSLASSKPQ